MRENKQQSNMKGFTLVEVLVSMAIFLLTISLGVVTIVTMNSASNRTKIKDQTVRSAYFLLDSLSRSIRMGKSYTCLDSAGTDLGASACTNTLAQGFGFIDQDANVVELTVVGGAIHRSINGAAAKRLHDPYSLTLQSAGFMVDGVGTSDSVQPFVTIRMVATYTYKGEVFTVPLQTTLTQREIDKNSAV